MGVRASGKKPGWMAGPFHHGKDVKGWNWPGKWQTHHPWSYLKELQMWCLGTRLGDGLGSSGLMVGLNGLKDLFQSKCFCGSLIL